MITPTQAKVNKMIKMLQNTIKLKQNHYNENGEQNRRGKKKNAPADTSNISKSSAINV